MNEGKYYIHFDLSFKMISQFPLMKKYLPIILLLLLVFPARISAQVSDRDVLYLILIESHYGEPDLLPFDNLEDLGILRAEPINDDYLVMGLYQVYLGWYIGRETAESVLSQVVARGYPHAQLMADYFTLRHGEGAMDNHSIQVGAYSVLDMKEFGSQIGMATLQDVNVYIMLEDGVYKILMGLFPESEAEDVRTVMLPVLGQRGIYGYVRRFR
jgi:hypothetical protein